MDTVCGAYNLQQANLWLDLRKSWFHIANYIANYLEIPYFEVLHLREERNGAACWDTFHHSSVVTYLEFIYGMQASSLLAILDIYSYSNIAI